MSDYKVQDDKAIRTDPEAKSALNQTGWDGLWRARTPPVHHVSERRPNEWMQLTSAQPDGALAADPWADN